MKAEIRRIPPSSAPALTVRVQIRNVPEQGKLLFSQPITVGEQNDVAAKHPDRVVELKTLFDAWRASMHPTVE